jgi:hypothetical protein
VIVAATGAQRALLQEEFASLTFVDLPGYRVRYGKNRAITWLRLICSIPKILIRIKQERAWLRGFAAREGLDLVISDNRYGLAVPGVFCVFITHQLLIRTPFGRWSDLLLHRINYRFIGRFSRCWVPDFRGPGALAGELSNPGRLPQVTTRYIGILSRMEGQRNRNGQAPEGQDAAGWPAEGPAAPEGAVLAILSGPEPQRTLLEKLILRQVAAAVAEGWIRQAASATEGQIVLVRGLPCGGTALKNVPPAVTVYDHLPAAALELAMAKARLVIARSGYSTVMDLARMGKRAVLIPTPGQTEQEYLGRYLSAMGWARCMTQNKFSLKQALSGMAPARQADETPWPVADDPGEGLRAEILSVLAQSRPALG